MYPPRLRARWRRDLNGGYSSTRAGLAELLLGRCSLGWHRRGAYCRLNALGQMLYTSFCAIRHDNIIGGSHLHNAQLYLTAPQFALCKVCTMAPFYYNCREIPPLQERYFSAIEHIDQKKFRRVSESSSLPPSPKTTLHKQTPSAQSGLGVQW